jgi:hypothetical protein
VARKTGIADPSFCHATIPGLPSPLWQAAFMLDLFRQGSQFEYGSEVDDMVNKIGDRCDEVLVWRKKKLGW